jgi:hypothetical protein
MHPNASVWWSPARRKDALFTVDMKITSVITSVYRRTALVETEVELVALLQRQC